MASAEKRGKSWRVRYKQPDGSWGSESGFLTKSAALKRGNDLEADMRHGRYVDPRKARTPFGEWAERWMAAQDVAPNTVAKRRRLLKNHLMPKWERIPLCDISLFEAKAWATQLTCAASTRRHVMTLLSMILTGAADAGLLLANPLYGRRISKKSTRGTSSSTDEKVWAQPEDAYEVAHRLIGVQRLMVITAAWTGLRWGELTGLAKENCLLLRRERLDGKPWVRHVIRVDPDVGSLHEVEVALTDEELAEWHRQEDTRLAQAEAEGREARRKPQPENRVELFLGPPKNEPSAREVDVPPFLVDLLSRHMAVWPNDLVFSPPNADYWRRGNFGRILRPAADGRTAQPARRGTSGRTGWEPILPGLTMHGLRHSHDTWMKEDRIDRSLRYLTMGWAVQDIEGVYEHVTPQMRRERLEGLEARWERARRGGWEPLRTASGS